MWNGVIEYSVGGCGGGRGADSSGRGEKMLNGNMYYGGNSTSTAPPPFPTGGNNGYGHGGHGGRGSGGSGSAGCQGCVIVFA